MTEFVPAPEGGEGSRAASVSMEKEEIQSKVAYLSLGFADYLP